MFSPILCKVLFKSQLSQKILCCFTKFPIQQSKKTPMLSVVYALNFESGTNIDMDLYISNMNATII